MYSNNNSLTAGQRGASLSVCAAVASDGCGEFGLMFLPWHCCSLPGTFTSRLTCTTISVRLRTHNRLSYGSASTSALR